MAVRFSLAASMLGFLLTQTVQPLFASGYITSYATEFSSGYTPQTVYKSVDSTGRITYSAVWPSDTIDIEEIAIRPTPSAEHVEKTRKRLEKISKTALELTEAREKREAERELAENKRLERLALQRSAQPQVYEKIVYVGWNPIWWRYRAKVHDGRYPGKHPSRMAYGPRLSRGVPLGTGTSLR